MSKKEQCKAIMLKLFGQNSADLVDLMSEDDCIKRCKEKVIRLLGAEKAKIFDAIK